MQYKESEAALMRLSGKKNRIFLLLFVIGWLLMLPGGFLSKRDNKDYTSLQRETFTLESIETVLEYKNLIYVCYGGGTIVNVYDRSGNFQWCVSTPYMRNCEFHIFDNMLVLSNYSDSPAYCYDALTGSFLSSPIANTLELPSYSSDSHIFLGELPPGQIGYDAFNIYLADASGNPEKIVSRPFWYWPFHFLFGWLLGFGSGLIYFFLFIFEEIQLNSYNKSKVFSRKVKWIVGYRKVFTVIHVLQIIINFVILPKNLMYILTTFGLVALFIVSMWVLGFLSYRLKCTDDERKAINKWQNLYMGSLVAMFILMIIAMVLFAR